MRVTSKIMRLADRVELFPLFAVVAVLSFLTYDSAFARYYQGTTTYTIGGVDHQLTLTYRVSGSNATIYKLNGTSVYTTAQIPYPDNVVLPDKVNLTIGGSTSMYTVTQIWDEAFKNCSSIKSMTIPTTITKIRDNAFAGCTALKTLNFNAINYPVDNSLQRVGWTNLQTINVGHGVKNIPVYFAYDCGSLTTVNFIDPASVKEIGQAAFQLASSLQTIADFDKLNIKNIPDVIFQNCTSLSSISIPPTVEEIGGEAFQNTSLTSITIPKGVRNIWDRAFNNCEHLTSVTCEAANPPYLDYPNNHVFDYTPSTLSILVPCGVVEDYRSSETWRKYANKIFGMDENITTVNGRSIMDIAMNGITYSLDITTPSSAILLDYKYSGEAPKAIEIPSTYTRCDGSGTITVTSVANTAFKDSTSLEYVFVPLTISNIEDSSFSGCTNLMKVVFSSTTPATLGQTSGTVHVFDGLPTGHKIYVPCSAYTAYTTSWTSVTDIASAATGIAEYAYTTGTALNNIAGVEGESWTFDVEITSLAPLSAKILGAGSSSVNGSTLTLPDSIIPTESGSSACTGHYEILPVNITKIDDNAFKDNTTITTVNLGKNVETVGVSSFAGCTGLQKVALSTLSSLEDIEEKAFAGCTALTTLSTGAQDTVEFPSSMITVGDSAFVGCKNISIVKISDYMRYINSTAFYSCDGIREFIENSSPYFGDENGALHFYGGYEDGKKGDFLIKYPPASTETWYFSSPSALYYGVIMPYAFENCKYLKNVQTSGRTSLISNHAFVNCDSLQLVQVYENDIIMEKEAAGNGSIFESCDNLVACLVPNGTLKSYTVDSVADYPELKKVLVGYTYLYDTWEVYIDFDGSLMLPDGRSLVFPTTYNSPNTFNNTSLIKIQKTLKGNGWTFVSSPFTLTTAEQFGDITREYNGTGGKKLGLISYNYGINAWYDGEESNPNYQWMHHDNDEMHMGEGYLTYVWNTNDVDMTSRVGTVNTSKQGEIDARPLTTTGGTGSSGYFYALGNPFVEKIAVKDFWTNNSANNFQG